MATLPTGSDTSAVRLPFLPAKPLALLTLAAPPGLMRNALLALLEATSPKTRIELADDLPSLQHLADTPNLARQIVIADVDLCAGHPGALIQAVNRAAPGAACILIVNTLAQQRESLAAGAQQALLKGFLDDDLRAAITPSRSTASELTHRFSTSQETQP